MRNYTLFMLMMVYLLSFLDRQIISILAEDIKGDLQLSDTQLGLLTGFAFAVFYAGLGVPVARLAEKKDRINIISICVAIWSLMTAMGGYAANFFQLALARAGVGVGEAGSVAPAHSIIADTFPLEKRSRAMAIFQLGVPLGILSGFYLGGTFSESIGWRNTLFLAGGVGVILALFVRVTLKDPRGSFNVPPVNSKGGAASTFKEDAIELLSSPAYLYLCLAATFVSAAGYAIVGFLPAYLIRTFGIPVGEVGMYLAMIIGIGGGVGLFAGGIVADYLAQNNKNMPLWVCVVTTALVAPLFTVAILFGTEKTIFLYLVFPFILNLAWMGPNWAMVQGMAPKHARATASAIVLLSINLFGLGVGPLLIGLASDMFSGMGVKNSLQIALLFAPVMFILATVFYWLALRRLQQLAAAPNLAIAS